MSRRGSTRDRNPFFSNDQQVPTIRPFSDNHQVPTIRPPPPPPVESLREPLTRNSYPHIQYQLNITINLNAQPPPQEMQNNVDDAVVPVDGADQRLMENVVLRRNNPLHIELTLDDQQETQVHIVKEQKTPMARARSDR